MKLRDRKRLARRAWGTAITFLRAGQIHWHDRQYREWRAEKHRVYWRDVFEDIDRYNRSALVD